MESETLQALVLMAFGMGMIHALDADHVMAVTTLASRRPRLSTCFGYAARWAAGHTLSLLAVVLLWIVLGLRLPDWIGVFAEWGVAALLIGMGAALLVALRRRRMRIAFHAHPGLPAHAHWQAEADEPGPSSHRHGALLIGALHGVAGSAPLLALIPAIAQGAPGWAIANLAVFSLGMLFAMLLCGGLLGLATTQLGARRLGNGVVALRAAIGVGAIGVGAHLAMGLWLSA